jgi:hydroxyacylglutathione hydrolase
VSDARPRTTVERAGGAAEPAHAVRARIEVGAFGPWQTNAYLVWDGSSPDALVIDPGMGAAAPLMDRAAANGIRVHLIADSHGHIDHIYDNAALRRASGAPLAIHPDDEYRLRGDNVYGFPVEPSSPDRRLRDGEQLRVGDLVFDVLHTPGHTEGSVCLYEERAGLVLSGDCLFPGGWGRTDLPGGNEEQMVESLALLARVIAPATRVLPGHGAETILGRELPWLRRVAATGRLILPG